MTIKKINVIYVVNYTFEKGMNKVEKTSLFYIKGIALGSRYKTEKYLAEYGVTQPQSALLLVLHKSIQSGEKINRKYLQETMQLSGPTITGLLEGLEKKHIIKRNINEQDKRALDIVITPSGMELVNKIQLVMTDQEHTIVKGMSQDEISLFYKLLKKAYSNVQ